MASSLSLDLGRNLSVLVQYRANAITRSAMESVRDIRRYNTEQRMTTPQDLGHHANLSIQGTQSRKSPQARYLDGYA